MEIKFRIYDEETINQLQALAISRSTNLKALVNLAIKEYLKTNKPDPGIRVQDRQLAHNKQRSRVRYGPVVYHACECERAILAKGFAKNSCPSPHDGMIRIG